MVDGLHGRTGVNARQNVEVENKNDLELVLNQFLIILGETA